MTSTTAGGASVGPTGGGSAGGSGGSTGSGGGFLWIPDGGAVCASFGGEARNCSCDPTQQRCPRDEKCTAWSNNGEPWWDDTRCVPEAGDGGAPGDACSVEGGPYTGIDDCARGSVCLYVDPDTLQGRCVAFCTGDWPPTCADPNLTCAIFSNGALPICVPPCDPLAASPCEAGQVCALAPTAGVGFVCVPAGSGGVGAPCEHFVDCQPGLTCQATGPLPGCPPGSACCVPYCDPTAEGADEACAAALATPAAACTPLDASAGACTVPG